MLHIRGRDARTFRTVGCSAVLYCNAPVPALERSEGACPERSEGSSRAFSALTTVPPAEKLAFMRAGIILWPLWASRSCTEYVSFVSIVSTGCARLESDRGDRRQASAGPQGQSEFRFRIFSRNKATKYHRISYLTEKRPENKANSRAWQNRFRAPLAKQSQNDPLTVGGRRSSSD